MDVDNQDQPYIQHGDTPDTRVYATQAPAVLSSRRARRRARTKQQDFDRYDAVRRAQTAKPQQAKPNTDVRRDGAPTLRPIVDLTSPSTGGRHPLARESHGPSESIHAHKYVSNMSWLHMNANDA
jgi:hypothetical protein